MFANVTRYPTAVCLLVLLLTTMFVGCTSSVETPLEETVELGETDGAGAAAESSTDVLLIDVRSKKEWDEGHIEGSIHIPHTEIADAIAGVSDDKSRKIVVYCAAGVRAGKAKTALEAIGYTDVENGGGIDDVRARQDDS
ncbi:MAG: rhodanese-like domain-containing protein [Planctomycetota bacterium]